jgi:hypothetical protein
VNKPPRPNTVAPRFPYRPQLGNPEGPRKININVGSPVKRTIDGFVWWSEERAFGGWRGLCKAVKRHKRHYRKFKKRQGELKRYEYMMWLEQQRQ